MPLKHTLIIHFKKFLQGIEKVLKKEFVTFYFFHKKINKIVYYCMPEGHMFVKPILYNHIHKNTCIMLSISYYIY